MFAGVFTSALARSLARPLRWRLLQPLTAARCASAGTPPAACRRRHITGAACTPPAGQGRTAFWVMEATSLKRGVREGGSVFVNNYILPARRLPGTFLVFVFFYSWLEKKGDGEREERRAPPGWMEGGVARTSLPLLDCWSIQDLQPRTQIGRSRLHRLSWLCHHDAAGQPCEFCYI